MPSPSTSRTRRSRAPSPESQQSASGDLLTKVATGVLAYSINHYLTRQLSSSRPKPSPSDKPPEEMPSKRSSSRSDQSRAFGFGSSSSRRDDPTHELISHLLRGAAALAARHWIKNRKKKKDKDQSNSKSKPRTQVPRPNSTRAPSGRDDFYAGPVPDRPPRGHHRRHRPHRHRPNSRYPPVHYPPVPRSELAVALDALSEELGRTTRTIRRLAGRRRPHRHRDGRCDVYEGLRESAGRLEGALDRVRAVGNNIRNLGEVPIRYTGGGGREVGGGLGEKREGSWVRRRSVPDGRSGTYVRTRPAGNGGVSEVGSREVPREQGQGEERKVRVEREEDRGRKRTRSR